MKRLLALVGLSALIAVLGVFAAVALAYQDDPTDHKVVICHASASAQNPYQASDVDKDSIQNRAGLDSNGHGTHVGPIFDPATMESGDNWGDIIPPFAAGYLAGPPEKEWGAFGGLNWTAEGQAIWENGCNVPGPPGDTPVAPIAPTFQDPTCDVGAAVHLPTVTGVTYAIEGTVAPGQKVTVTATADDGYVLEGTAEWEHTFGHVPDNCTPPPPPPPPPPPATEVTPGVTFQDPTCEVGAAVVPSTAAGVTYTIEGKVAPGEKVTVTASANDGYTIRGNDRWEHTFGLVPSNCATTPPPTDVCPNIDGVQEAVPDGLVVDAQGNCVAEKPTTETTPTAPLTPPTTPKQKAPAQTKPATTTKPAPLTPPKQAVAGAYAESPPKLAHTP
jgi:hypothetical protein